MAIKPPAQDGQGLTSGESGSRGPTWWVFVLRLTPPGGQPGQGASLASSITWPLTQGPSVPP